MPVVWSPPFTAAVGGAWTAAEWNQYIRDNLNFLHGAHACRLWIAGNTSCPDSVATPIPFDSESFDTDGFHDPATNPTRITIPSGLDGYYDIKATTVFAANAAGLRDCRIILNSGIAGGIYLNTGRVFNVGAGNPSRAPAATTYRLVAADYIEIQGFQTSGGALNALGGDIDQTQVCLTYLGN